MFKWIKKHWIISSLLALFLLPYLFWKLLEEMLWYFLFYDPEKMEPRYYPIDISQPGHIAIEYETDEYVKYWRCFDFHLRARQLKQKIPALLTEEYEFRRERDKAIIAEKIKNKPQLAIRVYKKGEVINEDIVYMLHSKGVREEWWKDTAWLEGYRLPDGYLYCFKEEPYTKYTIEVRNNLVLPEYKDVETNFVISLLWRK